MIHALQPGTTALRYRHCLVPFAVGAVLLVAGARLQAAPPRPQAVLAGPAEFAPIDLTGLGTTLTGLALVFHGLAACIRAWRGLPEAKS